MNDVNNPASSLREQGFKDSKVSNPQVLKVHDCGTKPEAEPQ